MVEVEIEVTPPTADVCFVVELTASSYTGPRRCLSPADRGRITTRLPASDPYHGDEPQYVVVRTSTPPAAAHLFSVTTTVSSPDQSTGAHAPLPPTFLVPGSSHVGHSGSGPHSGGGAPGSLLRGGLPPPPPACPSSTVSGECTAEEGRAMNLCRPDSAKLQRLYPNCRASDCSADVVRPAPPHPLPLPPHTPSAPLPPPPSPFLPPWPWP